MLLGTVIKRGLLATVFGLNLLFISAQDKLVETVNSDSVNHKQEKIKLYVSYPEIIDESALAFKYHIELTVEGIKNDKFYIFAKIDGLSRFLKFKKSLGLVVDFNEYINLLSSSDEIEIIDENKILEKFKQK